VGVSRRAEQASRSAQESPTVPQKVLKSLQKVPWSVQERPRSLKRSLQNASITSTGLHNASKSFQERSQQSKGAGGKGEAIR